MKRDGDVEPAESPDEATIFQVLSPYVDRMGGGPSDWVAHFATYLRLLVERNEITNLVSRRAAFTLIADQVVPSLATLEVVPPRTELKVLDIGSGGGFPGVPLKILRPDIEIHLLDATRKKAEFLEKVTQSLSLEKSFVHWKRAEDFYPEGALDIGFDRIFARAVGQPERISTVVRRILARNGSAWRFVSPKEASTAALPWKDTSGNIVTCLEPIVPQRNPGKNA